MRPEFSPAEVADRLRGILLGFGRAVNGDMMEATARRLGVSEVALRMSIDEVDPHPTLDVLIAVVHQHGVDPAWLVTGDYDQATHRAAIDDDAEPTGRGLAALVAKHMTPPGGTPPVPRGPFGLHA